jgi:hypothetical protein
LVGVFFLWVASCGGHVALTPWSLKTKSAWPTTTQEVVDSWPLTLQILFFTIGRVRVDKIEKKS